MPCDFRRFAEYSPTALAVFRADGRLDYANRAFWTLVSSGGDRTAAPRWDDIDLPPGLRDDLAWRMPALLSGGPEQQFTWDEGPGEEIRRFWCRLLPPAGEGEGAVMEVRELPDTERLKLALKAERLVRRKAERLKERGRRLFFDMLDGIPVYVYMQRRDYTVAYANQKTKNLYGETEGRLCYEVFSGRDTPCPACPTFRVFTTGRPEFWQFTDCEGRTFHVFDYPFEDEAGEPLVMELGIDVTQLKRVERELFQAHKMRAIGVLAGGMAHDLNNNLVPIIFNIDHALGRLGAPGDDPLAQPLAEALRAAYRAADLVAQVLEYSRQQNVSRAPLRLIPLCRENLDLLRASLPASVTLRAEYETERDCVSANPAQVQQLLLNLCRNGAQAMPQGGRLDVRVSALDVASLKTAPHPGLSVGPYVVLTVCDTGCGMDQATLDRVFEPFYTTKKQSGGTGMGLAVVHSIVTSAGGVIHVASQPGQGSTFTVYLPEAEPSPTRIVAEPSLTRRETGRLLLVDDDRAALRAMARTLRQAGFEVSVAADAGEGLNCFQQASGRFDLVLADQSMPGMDGVEMAGRMLEHDKSAKILICTGHVEPRLEARATAAGVAGFVRKPMTPRALVAEVRRHCR